MGTITLCFGITDAKLVDWELRAMHQTATVLMTGGGLARPFSCVILYRKGVIFMLLKEGLLLGGFPARGRD
jgi:hypothetical protein